jgi:hypothetical protein
MLTLGACAAARVPGEAIGGSYGGSDEPALKSNEPSTPTTTRRPSDAPVVVATKGSLSITIESQSGDKLAGVEIAFRGPQEGVVTTDANGVARRALEPGAYNLDVHECGDGIRVLVGGGADLTIVAGRTTRGVIDGIAWEPRYWPIAEVRAPVAPPWRIDDAFVLKTRVGDRCADSAPVSEAVTLDAWEYEVTSPVRLSRRPSMRSDAHGWLTARFVCDGNGNGDVVLKDPRAGTRYVHVLGAVQPPEGTTYCIGE